MTSFPHAAKTLPTIDRMFCAIKDADRIIRGLAGADTADQILEEFGVAPSDVAGGLLPTRLRYEFAERVLNDLAQWAWDIAEEKGFHEYNAERAQVVEAIDCATRCAAAGTPLPRAVQDALLMIERKTRQPVPVPEKLLLMDGEVAEAMEAYRDPRLDPTKTYVKQGGEYAELAPDDFDPKKKAEGVGVEVADVLIRGLHFTREIAVNIGREIIRKMLHNATREHRHGGKRA